MHSHAHPHPNDRPRLKEAPSCRRRFRPRRPMPPSQSGCSAGAAGEGDVFGVPVTSLCKHTRTGLEFREACSTSLCASRQLFVAASDLQAVSSGAKD